MPKCSGRCRDMVLFSELPEFCLRLTRPLPRSKCRCHVAIRFAAARHEREWCLNGRPDWNSDCASGKARERQSLLCRGELPPLYIWGHLGFVSLISGQMGVETFFWCHLLHPKAFQRFDWDRSGSRNVVRSIGFWLSSFDRTKSMARFDSNHGGGQVTWDTHDNVLQ